MDVRPTVVLKPVYRSIGLGWWKYMGSRPCELPPGARLLDATLLESRMVTYLVDAPVRGCARRFSAEALDRAQVHSQPHGTAEARVEDSGSGPRPVLASSLSNAQSGLAACHAPSAGEVV